jgi:hypothetical protein
LWPIPDDEQLRPRHGRGGAPSALDLHERVVLAVDDQRRDVELAQRGRAVAGRVDGQQLPRDASGSYARS